MSLPPLPRDPNDSGAIVVHLAARFSERCWNVEMTTAERNAIIRCVRLSMQVEPKFDEHDAVAHLHSMLRATNTSLVDYARTLLKPVPRCITGVIQRDPSGRERRRFRSDVSSWLLLIDGAWRRVYAFGVGNNVTAFVRIRGKEWKLDSSGNPAIGDTVSPWVQE